MPLSAFWHRRQQQFKLQRLIFNLPFHCLVKKVKVPYALFIFQLIMLASVLSDNYVLFNYTLMARSYYEI